jgi:5-methylcytosine-specific restriction endonuclease McrA
VRINLELGELAMEQLEPSGVGELPRKRYMERLRQKRPRLKLDPESYEALKNEVLERDGWRCQDCGSAKMLEVHHVQPRGKLGHDTSENLITLCVDCHARWHGINR